MLEYLKNSRILVIVAHPDDEVLGLGGSMHLLKRKFDCQVNAVILGEGITSRSDTRNEKKWEKELNLHKSNIESAKLKIGYDLVSTYNYPDNRFDSVAILDIIKSIEHEKEKFNPHVIFTHHGGDVNIDHQRTFEAVVTASRPMAHETVSTIITFETMSGTEWRASTDPRIFNPNFFIEIEEDDLNAKIDAMNQYQFERRDFPHPRSAEALRIRAQMWGVTIGVPFAEAFSIVRHIAKR